MASLSEKARHASRRWVSRKASVSPQPLWVCWELAISWSMMMHDGEEAGWSTDYNILQEHMGNIEVESEVGKGTRVTICLPMRESDVE